MVDIIKVFSFLPFGIFQEEGSWPTACYTNIRNVQFVSIKGKEVYLYLEVTALLKSCPLPTPPKKYIYIYQKLKPLKVKIQPYEGNAKQNAIHVHMQIYLDLQTS